MADLLRIEIYDQSSKATANISTAGSLQVSIDKTAEYIKALDYSGSNLIYIGYAISGSSKASEVWQITKLTWSGSNITDIQFADSNTLFDNIWNARASLSYG